MRTDFHKRIVIGVEIEAYSIELDGHAINRRLSRPRPGLSERGERFTHDTSIGSEYNSRPFSTVREALFLLKGGLRKYLRHFYRSRRNRSGQRVPLLVGGWTNRVAGTHLHISVDGRELNYQRAKSLSFHLHDHLPLLVAMGANSPVWDRRLTEHASCRMLHLGDVYFAPRRRGQLEEDNAFEMCFNPGRKSKPSTLELRVMDSNLPEFIVAGLCLAKAVALRWLRHRPASNRITYQDYLEARRAAAADGMRAKLPWGDEWIPARVYLDRFLWEHREELRSMDVPSEIFRVLRWLKRGYTGARILGEAADQARREHPQTWQRRFARRYTHGLEQLLSGNTLQAFAKELQVELADPRRTYVGRKGASIDG